VLLSPEWQDAYYAPFSSMDRFVLLLFPLYAWLAGRIHPVRWRTALPAGGLAMVGVATVHLLGGWVG
jgi:hypothetical protein